MDTESARLQYRSLRARSRLTNESFDREATRLAHEIADGEDVLPAHWVQAARELVHD